MLSRGNLDSPSLSWRVAIVVMGARGYVRYKNCRFTLGSKILNQLKFVMTFTDRQTNR
jgi:hypothetical protein